MIDVFGVVGGDVFGRRTADLLAGARVVIGAPRHLTGAAVAPDADMVAIEGPIEGALNAIGSAHAAGRSVAVLTSGDPGFFGLVRVLGERFGAENLRVHPAPSSIALAFARLGMHWDDAAVVSAHGRPLRDAIDVVLDAPKAAVLTGPAAPPEAVGAALLERGCGPRCVAVISQIGEPSESIVRTDLAGLEARSFDPLSVVILTVPDGRDSRRGSTGRMGLAWGLPETSFVHRGGMITKAEVRAIVLGKLALSPTGVLWDVGAGSGSVAIEAARICSGLRVLAIEKDLTAAERIAANAAAHGVAIDVVVGSAPDALALLQDPDRVFVGGGGIAALEAARARLRPGGVIVATYALVDRAAQAWRLLGNMVEIQIARGEPAAGGVRLAAENPVFICWSDERNAERIRPGVTKSHIV